MVGPALRCGVVGAGRTRNGLGPFLARFVEAAGGTVVGVAGRSAASASRAAAALAAEFEHPVAAHDSVIALCGQGLDALVIAAPDEAHLPALRVALDSGVATLCEKPLVTAEEQAAVGPLIDGFCERGLLLVENCQWPLVLPLFEQLFGRALPEPPRQVAMRLSPMTPGPDMLRSSLSHLLSVVQALVPVGEQTAIAALRFAGAGAAADGLTTSFVLRDETAPWPDVACRLELEVCPAQPRPAWVEIDGHRMERVVELPAYDISFLAGEKRISIDDPSRALVYRFVQSAREASIERNRIEAVSIGQRARLYSEIIHRFVGWIVD